MATKKKATAPASTNETPAQKLARLANARVGKALKALDLVGNLGAYKPTEEQVKAIVQALDARLSEVEGRLKGSKTKATGFSL